MQQIELLEEKVKKLIEVTIAYQDEIKFLKTEIESLKSELSESETEISNNNGYKEMILSIEKEKEILINEKNMVKSTIEKLIKEIENIM